MTSENSYYILTCPVKILLQKAVKRNCVIFFVLKNIYLLFTHISIYLYIYIYFIYKKVYIYIYIYKNIKGIKILHLISQP